MLSKRNWSETKAKWDAYWKRANSGTPLMCIVAEKPGARSAETEALLKSRDMEDKYQNAARIAQRYRYFARTHEFLAESFPNVSLDFGPGSMAAYLGSEITFGPGTVWFGECVSDWKGRPPLRFDENNPWFQRHIRLFKQVKALAGDEYYLAMPDIMENIDVLASLRGAQNTIFDMMDEPEETRARIEEVQALYYQYYDRFFALAAREEDGVASSCYTVFQIWGRGKTLKLQCDFSAMMSPAQFRAFVQPALRAQAQKADHTLYHLDGPDAIRHVPALMEIDEIDALQWTSGSYNPDGTFAQWYPIYDAVARAKKALWVQVYSGTPDEWIARIDALVQRYGSNALFLYFAPMKMETAERILSHAETHWKDVEGSFR